MAIHEDWSSTEDDFLREKYSGEPGAGKIKPNVIRFCVSFGALGPYLMK